MLNKTPAKPDDATESALKRRRRSPLIGIALILVGVLLVGSGIKTILHGSKRAVAPRGIIKLEVVSSRAEREKGLSGRDGISPKDGMLFVFESSSMKNCFWMKDMKFAIDMVFLDAEKRVVTVHEHVAPESFPQSFCPSSNATYGLELSDGNAARLGLSTGESLKFKL